MVGVDNHIAVRRHKNFYGNHFSVKRMQVEFIKVYSVEEKIKFMNTALEYSLSKNTPYYGTSTTYIAPEITIVMKDDGGIKSSFTSSNMMLQYLREGETVYSLVVGSESVGILTKSNLKWRQFIATRFVGIVTNQMVDSALKTFESPDTIWQRLQSGQNPPSDQRKA